MLTNNEMKDGLKCSLLQPPERAVDTQACPHAGDATDALCSIPLGAGTVGSRGCHCHADALPVHTRVSAADVGPCGAQGGRHRGPVGPGALPVQLPLPSASRVSVRPSLLAVRPFPLTSPAQYVFKGASFQTPAKLLHLLRPVCILSDLASGAQHGVPEVYPRGRGCLECVHLCSLPMRRVLPPAWAPGRLLPGLRASCLGSVPPAWAPRRLLPGCVLLSCCVLLPGVGCLQWTLLTYLRFSHGHPLLLCTS